MKKLLVIDCTMRENSRTRRMLESFLKGVNTDRFAIEIIKLPELGLKPLDGDMAEHRALLLKARKTDDPMFDLAKQFVSADVLVFAAPYWDMSFPAMLKIYIENICVEGITFTVTETGFAGLAKADTAIFLTARGGFTATGSMDDQATPYLNAVGRLLGYGDVTAVSAHGQDIDGFDSESVLKEACAQAQKLAETLS